MRNVVGCVVAQYKNFTLISSVSKQPCVDRSLPADIETKCPLSFTFLKVNQREYHEDQTPSSPQRPDNDMHNNPIKDNRSEIGRYCVEVFLHAVSNDKQQTLALQCYVRHVHSTLCNNNMDF